MHMRGLMVQGDDSGEVKLCFRDSMTPLDAGEGNPLY